MTNLQKRRVEKGYTQGQLATMTGISLWTIREYEQGRRILDKSESWRAVILADALDCSVEELMENEYHAKRFRKRK